MEHKIKNRIREIRISRGFSQESLGEKIGKARGEISRVENGKVGFSNYWLEKLSAALDCSPAELIADVEDLSSSKIPVIGEVPGGDLTLAIQEPPDKFIPFSSKRKSIFALRVRGNSMSRIAPDGSYAVVDVSDNTPDQLSNQPVVALIHNGFEYECSFKIFKRHPDRFEPLSVEPGYDTIFPGDREWKIFGRVIGSVSYIGSDAKLLGIEEQPSDE